MLDGAVQVGRRLDVHADDVGARVRELLDVALGLDDHEVDVERQLGRRAHGPHDERADGDVGDEAAVHDVDVDVVGAGGLGGAHLLGQPAEVG